MKMTYRTTILLFVFLISFAGLKAQEKLQMKLGYHFSMPAGYSFKNAISNPSFRGVAGEITYPLNEQISVGLLASFSDYYQKYPRALYDSKDGQVSAVLTNSIQTTPILARVNYHFVKEGAIRPYAGIGAGINWVMYSRYLGEFPNSRSTVKPAVSGMAGVNIPFGNNKSYGLTLGANFNYLPFNYNAIRNLNSWGIQAGMFFPLK